ncbi:MAG: hypothetical protein Tp1123SUR197351_20 [Prokaryotic dsDNA virus sp.]|nr:MAG: hypothetical protein Tp1123SUR197351_20 [Prokaryotic dsDNA virus sp.]QDP57551.1 MAG: hypothetical protein Tp1124SUR703682_22 [Prokaryotic dsDNA virus sp.]|tara:strand:- start:3623 stop:3958 length:336 start_codon:yes stop_codon:yes gene_type:complete
MRWSEVTVLVLAIIILFFTFRDSQATSDLDDAMETQMNSYLPCLPTQQTIDQLKNLGEERIWRGLSARGHITEIWVNKKTLKWSAVVHTPSGHSCLPDGGDHGEILQKPGA